MNEQDILAKEPDSATHYDSKDRIYKKEAGASEEYDYFWMINKWLPVRALHRNLTRSLADIKLIAELRAENDALRPGLLSAAHEIGFLSDHLRGRMAQGAIEEMAKKADQWVALASQGEIND